MTQESHVVMQIIVNRSDELSKVSEDVRIFTRRMRKELGEGTSFEIQVGINPLATDIDQRHDIPAPSKAIGFLTSTQGAETNGTQENTTGRA